MAVQKVKARRFMRWTSGLIDKAAGSEIDRQILAAQVDSGRAELWHFDGAGINAAVLMRQEIDEMVIVMEGRGAKSVVPIIEKAAKKAGCKRLRAHTKRPGLHRMFPEWELKEYVYQKEI